VTPLLIIPVWLARRHFSLMIALFIPLLIAVGFDAGQIETKLVEAPFVIRDCAAPNVIDDTELWSHGAHVIYFNGDQTRIEYARPRRGMRPWSVGWKNKAD
jgi:hypothetical protein